MPPATDDSRERAKSAVLPARDAAHTRRDGDLFTGPRHEARPAADSDHRVYVGCCPGFGDDRHLLRIYSAVPGKRSALHPDAATGCAVLWADCDRSVGGA